MIPDEAQPSCEAELRNQRALYLLNIQRGNGAWCLGEIERALRGDDEPDTCCDADV